MLIFNASPILNIAEILDAEQQSINYSWKKRRISIKALHFCIGENLRFNRGASGFVYIAGLTRG